MIRPMPVIAFSSLYWAIMIIGQLKTCHFIASLWVRTQDHQLTSHTNKHTANSHWLTNKRLCLTCKTVLHKCNYGKLIDHTFFSNRLLHTMAPLFPGWSKSPFMQSKPMQKKGFQPQLSCSAVDTSLTAGLLCLN